MRLAGGHENHLPALQLVWLATNHNFGITFHHLHQCVEWCRVLAQALAFVESEDCHVASRLLDDLAADDRAVLVVHQLGGLRYFGGGESFEFRRSFRLYSVSTFLFQFMMRPPIQVVR